MSEGEESRRLSVKLYIESWSNYSTKDTVERPQSPSNRHGELFCVLPNCGFPSAHEPEVSRVFPTERNLADLTGQRYVQGEDSKEEESSINKSTRTIYFFASYRMLCSCREALALLASLKHQNNHNSIQKAKGSTCTSRLEVF